MDYRFEINTKYIVRHARSGRNNCVGQLVHILYNSHYSVPEFTSVSHTGRPARDQALRQAIDGNEFINEFE